MIDLAKTLGLMLMIMILIRGTFWMIALATAGLFE